MRRPRRRSPGRPPGAPAPRPSLTKGTRESFARRRGLLSIPKVEVGNQESLQDLMFYMLSCFVVFSFVCFVFVVFFKSRLFFKPKAASKRREQETRAEASPAGLSPYTLASPLRPTALPSSAPGPGPRSPYNIYIYIYNYNNNNNNYSYDFILYYKHIYVYIYTHTYDILYPGPKEPRGRPGRGPGRARGRRGAEGLAADRGQRVLFVVFLYYYYYYYYYLY